MKKVKYRYIGWGDYLAGVPARDLTDDDLQDLNTEVLESSGLYVRVETHMKTGPTENFSIKNEEKDEHGRH